MKERGMIFNAEMVKAIIDGRKTMTRRIMKPQPEPSKVREGDYWFPSNKLRSMVHVSDFIPGKSKIPDAHEFLSLCCPFGAVGDRLWVRETWAEAGASAPNLKLYRANYPEHVPSHYENVPPAEEIRWTPSIHMPRWASRITLEITGVRVERLQGISEEDAKAEGAPTECSVIGDKHFPGFRSLWRSIYGPESWQANLWVWVFEFRVIENRT